MIFEAIVGAAGAAAVIVVGAASGRRQPAIYALGLVGAALVYVGFAAFRGGRDHLAVEAAGLALYSLIAFFGVRRWPVLLAAGWAAHVLWDLLLHPTTDVAAGAGYVPGWYPAACSSFDLVVAAYLAWWLRRRAAAAAATTRARAGR